MPCSIPSADQFAHLTVSLGHVALLHFLCRVALVDDALDEADQAKAKELVAYLEARWPNECAGAIAAQRSIPSKG